MRILLAGAAVALLVGGCGLLGNEEEEDALAAGRETCRLVVDGIDAFNEGSPQRSVEAFRAALEPAEEYQRLRDDASSAALLEAVEYYAALPAQDYRSAFEGSPEFRRHQETTLGQCTAPGQPTTAPDEQQT